MLKMRYGIKNFKEFHQAADWRNYVNTYMSNTKEQNTDTEIKVTTSHGEIIAVWQKHGYGYIEECRTAERLSKQIAA
jgi:hypothetical protein